MECLDGVMRLQLPDRPFGMQQNSALAKRLAPASNVVSPGKAILQEGTWKLPPTAAFCLCKPGSLAISPGSGRKLKVSRVLYSSPMHAVW